jgi:hypothetical protein
MTKKIQTKTEKLKNWYDLEIEKDKLEIEQEKLKFIEEIKKNKKEDILPQKPEIEKLSLWKRMKKVILGI